MTAARCPSTRSAERPECSLPHRAGEGAAIAAARLAPSLVHAGEGAPSRDWLFLSGTDTFDDAARVVVVAGKRRRVQPLVWEFLSPLRKHAGQYLDRDRIYVALWGHRERDERGIEVCAHKARECLKGTPTASRAVTGSATGW